MDGSPYLHFLRSLALLSWLVKDVGWILLMWPVACLGAFFAVSLQAFLLIQAPKWVKITPAVQLHTLATFIWLCGNFVWMIHEFLYDGTEDHLTPGREFPWHQGPLLYFDSTAYSRGVSLVQTMFIAGLVLLFVTYAAMLLGLLTEKTPTQQDDLFWGLFDSEIYTELFIGPWIAKDLFWTFGMFWPAVCCSILVILLTLDCLRRYRELSYSVELCWVLGNLVWLSTELCLEDSTRCGRLLGACFLTAGSLLGVADARQTWQHLSLYLDAKGTGEDQPLSPGY